MLLFPNAKINVGLDVLRRRDDGFHELRTLMVPVRGLCDVLEITPCEGLEFVQTGTPTDCPVEDNLCVRAYRLMEREYGVTGARIHLHKIIPSGAGLGGGSADAAFTLTGLNRVYELGLTIGKLEEMAARLGSDTAFFVRNEPALAQGRGEILSPAVNPFAGRHIVLVLPPVHVSTREAYQNITPRVPETPLAGNAFEAAIFPRYPLLARIKQALLDHGAEYASMSGSGSAVYGIFDAEPGAFCFSEKKCTTLRFILT